ncbi:anthocyanidin 3-O-glucosyltransferase 7 [Selaginella moellendorffii]|uniref:anthocyanidin 3-O-glucosyltransferase 7 n=1 Tax=Selaginella moellendorffii TaxID=88036 RepID=UPI000D1C37FB|nr:anthocyanidin 3-O-glucosyltransferase 7 [Selaginella moellendorffii]|eukprot:XP_024543543.1 anthocyanidin 3-O-glucosyltransferase 7 [Selaginella moellendorffii]
MEEQHLDHIHILAVPFFLKGHEIPLLHLCRHLHSLTGGRIAVTILQLPQNKSPLSGGATPSQREKGLEFVRYEDLPLEPPAERSLQLFLDFFPKFKALGGAVSALWRHRRVTCVITDVLVGWGGEVARDLGVPWVAFWTSTMTELAVYSNLPRLISENAIKDLEATVKVPGLPDLKALDYTTLHHATDPNFRGKVLVETFVEAVRYSTQADRVLANSSHALEGNAVRALELCGINIVPVGPLHLNISTGGDPDDPNQVIPWLDKQEPRSVLYIAFGTVAPVPAAQFEQIALALESTKNIAFLWVVRPEQLKLVPKEFGCTARYAFKSGDTVNGTVYRGLLTDWAPQVAVLGHRAVGGFLTHCGWNSILESITVGVPVISMPRMADQCLTRKILDEEWGVSVRLGNTVTDAVSKTDLEAAIEELMFERRDELGKKASDLGELARQGMEEGGSSRSGIDSLVKDLLLWK